MSKICPNCKQEFDDSAIFCASCGGKLEKKKDNWQVNVGDAAAISGGVNINQSHNITSHDNHYHSTIHERQKSDEEIKLEALNQIRTAINEILDEKNIIDEKSFLHLKAKAGEKGIDDVALQRVINEVKDLHKKKNTLSATNLKYIQNAQRAIEINDMKSFEDLSTRIEKIASVSLLDDVQYLAYLNKTVFNQEGIIEKYEASIAQNYWLTFWTIVTFLRSKKIEEAINILGVFSPESYGKSEDDSFLLEAYNNIVQGNIQQAEDFISYINSVTDMLKPMYRAIVAYLKKEYTEDSHILFYMGNVLGLQSLYDKAQTKTENAKKGTKESTQPNADVTVTNVTNAGNVQENQTEHIQSKGIKTEASIGEDKGDKVENSEPIDKELSTDAWKADLELGTSYLFGNGVEEDVEKAIPYLKKAESLGSAEAAKYLGIIYYNRHHYLSAEEHLEKIAELDDAEVHAMLADAYYQIEKYRKSKEMAKKAILHPECRIVDIAYVVMAKLYKEGRGGYSKDWFKQEEYLIKADKIGNAEAVMMLGEYYSAWIGDLDKSMEYYLKASNNGSCEAMYCVAKLYKRKKDLNNYKEWVEKASKAGCQNATLALKRLKAQEATEKSSKEKAGTNTGKRWTPLAEAEIKKESYNQAVEYLLMGQNSGESIATQKITELGEIADRALNNKDFDKAYKIYDALSKSGIPLFILQKALLNTGAYVHYTFGIYPKETPSLINYAEGIKSLKCLYDKGDFLATFWLGYIHMVGLGVGINFNAAKKYFVESLDRGENLPDHIRKQIDDMISQCLCKRPKICDVYVEADGSFDKKDCIIFGCTNDASNYDYSQYHTKMTISCFGRHPIDSADECYGSMLLKVEELGLKSGNPQIFEVKADVRIDAIDGIKDHGLIVSSKIKQFKITYTHNYFSQDKIEIYEM